MAIEWHQLTRGRMVGRPSVQYFNPWLTADLSPLFDNARSPFYQCEPDVVVEILKNGRVRLGVSPRKSADRSDGTEGYLLFRQLYKQTHIYIPLDGVINFFSALPYQDQTFQTGELTAEPGSRLSLDVLRESARFMFNIGPGQIAGQLEIYMTFLKRIKRAHVHQRIDAIRKTYLLELTGRWLLSGLLSNNTQVLKIPIEVFLNLLNDLPMCNKLFDSKDGQERLARRLGDELMLRQAQAQNYSSMLAKGLYSHVLALQLYEYWVRKKENMIYGSRPRVAWYLNIQDLKIASKAIKALEELDLNGNYAFRRLNKELRPSRNGNVFSFEPNAMLSHYKTGMKLGAEATTRPAKTRPLTPSVKT